jgi:hypothetical protein
LFFRRIHGFCFFPLILSFTNGGVSTLPQKCLFFCRGAVFLLKWTRLTHSAVHSSFLVRTRLETLWKAGHRADGHVVRLDRQKRWQIAKCLCTSIIIPILC